jgi:hypothetical protein
MQSVQYRKDRRERFIAEGLCPVCGKRPPIAGQAWCVPCRQRNLSAGAKDHARLKRIIYEYYGDRCNCCGKAEPKFLTIDHVNNDGGVQRKKDKTGGTNFYRITATKIQFGEPPIDLQILCRNCNWGKHVNDGVCPHISKHW